MGIFGRFFGGKEVPDSTPVEVPLRLKRPLTMQEEMQRFIRVEASRAAEAAGYETFEESLDFDVDDDEPLTAHEVLDMQEEYLQDTARDADRRSKEAELVNHFRSVHHGKASDRQGNGGDSPRKDGGVIPAGDGGSRSGSGGDVGADQAGDSKGESSRRG